MRGWALAVCVALVGTVLAGCATTGNRDLPEEKVLFIGNSFTYYNGGVDQVLHGLAPNTQVDSATQGGYRLVDHLNDAGTMGKLRQAGWTRVVLQEQSQYVVLAPAGFLGAAKRLVAEVRTVGAAPVLLMTWARPDTRAVSTAALKSAYTKAGTPLRASVIPAGVAFGATLTAHPGIRLNEVDGHPTAEGTYLAGCVTYATIFGVSPVGNTFTGGLDAGVAAILQQEAASATGRSPAHS